MPSLSGYKKSPGIEMDNGLDDLFLLADKKDQAPFFNGKARFRIPHNPITLLET
jgi:hypothetical protein